MSNDLQQFERVARSRSVGNKRFLGRLKRFKGRKLDEAFREKHDEVFAETDCLTCANCCKSTSPIFHSSDIERASHAVGMNSGCFVETYLRMDEDGDYVLKEAPCAFLEKDNRCRIYEDRPKACRTYPHTNRKRIDQLLDLTHRNTLVCPAVLEIVERLKKILL